ncbi:MAG: glycosyltransferase [Candidatus Hydrogenedens sp.]|nr:glycosyltransferase [Candidatus Hydrogenedens sp.]
MNAPKVYVLVINWNGRPHLQDCFASLLASDYVHFNAILLDNASTDDSVAWFEAHFGGDAHCEVWACPQNLGWGGGNAYGIERALAEGADYIFLLNNDTAIAPDALRLLVEHGERAPDCAALAPRMLLFDTPSVLNSVGLRLSSVGAAWDIGVGRADGTAWHAENEVAGVCGGAMFLRAEALRACGNLSPVYDIYYDDLDLCLRFWNAGWRCVSSPAACVRHKFSATLGQASARKHHLNERNRWRCLLLNWPAGLILRQLPRLAWCEVRVMGAALRAQRPDLVLAQMRGWASNLAFLPEGLGLRRARVRSGQLRGGFQHLVSASPAFCPPLTLPSNGWYPSEMRDGAAWSPMAPEACLPPTPGKLSVSLANWYCPEEDLAVAITTPGGGTAEVRTGDVVQIQADNGATLVARQIYEQERTGFGFDTGAWVRFEQHGAPVDPRNTWERHDGGR